MRILFSPVGTADPLTQLGDGPMLHIVRHYHPDKIVLFLSPAMAIFESSDNRYSKAIELLVAATGASMPEVDRVLSEADAVHRYDHYIEEFSKLLIDLNDANPGAQILVNVSSGTPAMQQALVAFDSFDQLGLLALQVATPANDMNKNGDREDPNNYDFETLWELNPDNVCSSSSRCLEVESVHFKDLILRDNICTLIEDYDYAAALRLARQSNNLDSDAVRLIEGCALRLNLEGQKSIAIFGGTEFSYSPDRKGQLAEYLYTLEVRLANEQWADFVRALTPAITETMFAFLRCDLADKDWLQQTAGGRIERKLDIEKIDADSRLKKVLGKTIASGSSKTQYVYNDALIALLKEFGSDQGVVSKLESLRDLEREARNKLAHEIVRSNKDTLEKAAGIKLEKAMDILFELNDVEPGLYRRINQKIIAAL